MENNVTKEGIVIYLPRYIGECSIKMPILYVNKEEQYDLTGLQFEEFEKYDMKKVSVTGDIFRNEEAFSVSSIKEIK